jgi:hypothetical protein
MKMMMVISSWLEKGCKLYTDSDPLTWVRPNIKAHVQNVGFKNILANIEI